jgi:hypothetical protein
MAKRCTRGDLPVIDSLSLALPYSGVILVGFASAKVLPEAGGSSRVPALTSVMRLLRTGWLVFP